MKALASLMLLSLSLLVGCAQTQQEAETTEPAEPARGLVEGVWRLSQVTITGGPNEGTIPNPQPSLYMFGQRHYSIMRVNGTEARPLWPEGVGRADLTDSQVRATFGPFIANAGEYETDGTMITTRPIVALSPNFMSGGSETFVYQVEGDQLVLVDTTVTPATEVRFTLTRLE